MRGGGPEKEGARALGKDRSVAGLWVRWEDDDVGLGHPRPRADGMHFQLLAVTLTSPSPD